MLPSNLIFYVINAFFITHWNRVPVRRNVSSFESTVTHAVSVNFHRGQAGDPRTAGARARTNASRRLRRSAFVCAVWPICSGCSRRFQRA